MHGILREVGHPWLAWIRGWPRTQPGHPWICPNRVNGLNDVSATHSSALIHGGLGSWPPTISWHQKNNLLRVARVLGYMGGRRQGIPGMTRM